MPSLTSTASIFNNVKKEQWTLIQTIEGLDTFERVGDAVAVSGNIGAISAGTGLLQSVKVYNLTTGSLLYTHTYDSSNPGISGINNYGVALDISGEFLVVGFSYIDQTSTAHGGFDIFNLYTGVRLYTFLGNDVSDQGKRLEVAEDLLLLGKQSSDGVVKVFDISTSPPTAGTDISYPGPVSPNQGWGWGLAIEKTTTTTYTVAISARFQVVGGVANQGAVYVYSINSSTLSSTLLHTINSPIASYTNFGTSMLIDNNELIIAATRYSDGRGSQVGRVYFYDLSVSPPTIDYTLENPISGADAASDLFGFELKLSGNRLLVGSLGANSSIGEVHIFDRDSKQLITKIVSPDVQPATTSDFFGYYHDIGNQYAVVGAFDEDAGGVSNSGAAYVFRYTK